METGQAAGSSDAAATPPTLAKAVAALAPLPGTAYHQQITAALQDLARTYALKLDPRRLEADVPLTVVAAGGTNVGKTSVLNAVLETPIGEPTATARGTKAAAAFVHESAAPIIRSDVFLPGFAARPLETPADANRDREPAAGPALYVQAHTEAHLREVCVLDAPDMDSVLEQNRAVARDLLRAADAVLFCASEEKYNDETCVEFLRDALQAGRRVVCVLNKHQTEEVRADLETQVVAQAAADAGLRPDRGPRVLTVPFLPAADREAALGRAVGGVRAALFELVRDRDTIRTAAKRGTAQWLREQARPVLERLRTEEAGLAAYRRQIQGVCDRAVAAYRQDLRALPLVEFQRAFQLLADALRVPVLDDVYDRLKGAARPLFSRVRRAFGLADPQDARAQVLADRDRRELRQAALRLGEALTAARACLEASPADLRGGLERGVARAADAAALFQLDETFGASLRETAEAWVDQVVRDLHATLAQRPRAVALAKALKGVLRIGAAAGAVVLTGHVGLEDLIVAPATDLLVSWAGRQALDKAYFDAKREAFYDRRTAVFRALTEARVGALALAALPEGASSAAIDRVQRALDRLDALEVDPDPLGAGGPA